MDKTHVSSMLIIRITYSFEMVKFKDRNNKNKRTKSQRAKNSHTQTERIFNPSGWVFNP